MQLAHRRRPTGPSRGSRPFRASSADRSLGVVLVEAAFVTPIFFMLVLGIMEAGLAMNDNLALAHTVRAGTRVASASGNDGFADYGIIQSIKRESAALPRGQVKMIVVYRPSSYGALPSPDCQNGTPRNPNGSTTAPACNVYTPADFNLAKNKFGCTPVNAPDRHWCPATRDVVREGGTDYVGVWMKIEHPWLTRMFGTTLTLTDSSVIRLEPRARA